MRKLNKTVTAAFAILGLAVGLVATIGLVRLMPGDSQKVHAQVRQEFESFAPPAASVLVQNNDIGNIKGGLVGAYYTTSLTFNEVRQHYEKQLIERGYTFREFKPLKSWGKDYGEQVVHYCKGDTIAGLYTPGSVTTQYQFSFSISAKGFECR